MLGILRPNRVWLELEAGLPQLAGISIQAFDPGGAQYGPRPPLPPFCTLLDRHPVARLACQNDCFRKASTLGFAARILPARCYVGLSYRIVPVRLRNRPALTLLVGRVPTELFGARERAGILERFHLDRNEYLGAIAASRHFSVGELDHVAELSGRFARSLLAMKHHLGQRSELLHERRKAFSFARDAARAPLRGRSDLVELLERYVEANALAGALLLHGEPDGALEVAAAVRMAPADAASLLDYDWAGVFAGGEERSRVLAGAANPLGGRGRGDAGALLALCLVHGDQRVGYLLLPGVTGGPRAQRRLESCADFLAARVHAMQGRERAEHREREARLLHVLGERGQKARSVGELLPIALETAMQGLQAQRGSILLASPETGKVTAQALHGHHAPLAGTITALEPNSVSHHVFYTKSPLLVRDVGRERGIKRERQYPYATSSFVSVPIRENGHALGVLHLTERDEARGFTRHDLATLEKVGLRTASLIRAARLEEEIRELRVLSATDPLTGAANRRHLDQQIEAEFQRAVRFHQPLAVAMMDLDDFKTLNDRLGHECGDAVLREVVRLVRGQVRSIDTLARYGGDEFVLLLPGTDFSGALGAAAKIREAVESAPLACGRGSVRIPVTVSIGVAALAGGTVSGHELLHRADEELLAAKQRQRNVVLG